MPGRARQLAHFVALIVGGSSLLLFFLWHQEKLGLDQITWPRYDYGTKDDRLSPSGGGHRNGGTSLDLTLESLNDLYEAHRIHLLRDYDPASDHRELGYKDVGSDSNRGRTSDLEAYVDRLQGFVDIAFPRGTRYHSSLMDSLYRLQNHVPTTLMTSSSSSLDEDSIGNTKISRATRFPQKISTTNKSPFDMPDIFSHWSILHPRQDGWTIQIHDDEAMEGFVRENLEDPMGGEGEGHGEKGENQMLREWDGLEKIVFKSDTFRYLMMLVEGGIYTDSDTAPVTSVDTWGHDYESIISPELGALQTILKQSYHPLTSPSASLHSGPSSLDFSSDHNPSSSPILNPNPLSPFYDHPSSYISPISDDGINIILSLEVDGVHLGMGDDWRENGMSRKVQICQWSLVAKPLHPIFIDVLETIFTSAKTRRESKETSGEAWDSELPDALEFTGPGPFTDSVFRYLLLQYGVTAHDLVGMEGSKRIGDVLILPPYSFSQPPPGNEHASTGAIHHEYKGRWRGSKGGQNS